MSVTLAPIPIDLGAPLPRVEILGVFGAGKTTLAKRMTSTASELRLERHDQNPFWANAEVNDRLGYLGYDLTFLLHHAYLVASSCSKDSRKILLCDWSFATDRLWASMRLAEDFRSYLAVHDAVLSRVGRPAGFLYLRQPVDRILERLLERGRIQEAELATAIETATNHLDELVDSMCQQRIQIVDDSATPEQLRMWVSDWLEKPIDV
jgi:deoxyadenosine/deoxycytidine kinase